MFYKIFADFVVLVHFLWIVFLLLGAVWGIRSKVIRIIHVSGLSFAVLIQVLGWYCPLTHLEVWLRSKHNPDLSYTGSFIIHYLEEIVYLELSQAMVFGLTIILCLFNLWIYLARRRKTR